MTLKVEYKEFWDDAPEDIENVRLNLLINFFQ